MTRSLFLLTALGLLTSACPAPSDSSTTPPPTDPPPLDDELPPVTSEASALCDPTNLEPSDVPAITFTNASLLVRVLADGTEEILHDFATAEHDEVSIRSLITAGSFSAVLGRSDVSGQFFATFDSDGELIAKDFRNGTSLPHINDMYLNEEGWMTAYTGQWSGFVVSPEGNYMELPNVVPTAAPFAGGRVSVVRNEWAEHERAWWTPESGLEPLAFSPREFLLHRVGDHLVYTADVGDGDLQLILEDGETVEQIDLPDDAPRVEPIETERWVMLGGAPHSGNAFRVIRVAPSTGTIQDLDVELPEGFWTMRNGTLDLDATGALILPIRTDGAAGLFRSENGLDWELIGEAVYGMMNLVNGNRGGAVLSRAVPNMGSPFTDEEYGQIDTSWTPIEGDHFQFIRPSDGQSWVLPAAPAGEFWGWGWAEDTRAQHYISRDGTCAAYWDTESQSGPQLRLIHIDEGPLDLMLSSGDGSISSQVGPIAFYNL